MVFLWYLYGILMVFIWYLHRTYFLPKARKPQGLGLRLPCQQIVFRFFLGGIGNFIYFCKIYESKLKK